MINLYEHTNRLVWSTRETSTLAYLGSDEIQRQVKNEQRNDSVSAEHLGINVG